MTEPDRPSAEVWTSDAIEFTSKSFVPDADPADDKAGGQPAEAGGVGVQNAQPMVKDGKLFKKGGGNTRSNWTCRYFTLEAGLLVYYADSGQRKGAIELRNLRAEKTQHSKREWAFTLTHKVGAQAMRAGAAGCGVGLGAGGEAGGEAGTQAGTQARTQAGRQAGGRVGAAQHKFSGSACAGIRVSACTCLRLTPTAPALHTPRLSPLAPHTPHPTRRRRRRRHHHPTTTRGATIRGCTSWQPPRRPSASPGPPPSTRRPRCSTPTSCASAARAWLSTRYCVHTVRW